MKQDFNFPKKYHIVFEYFIILYIKNINMDNKFMNETIKKFLILLTKLKIMMAKLIANLNILVFLNLKYSRDKKIIGLIKFNIIILIYCYTI